MSRKRVQSGAKDAAPDLTPEPRRQPRYERSITMDPSAELAAAMAEIERLRGDVVVAQRNAEAWRTEAEEQRPVLAYHKTQRDEARAALRAVLTETSGAGDNTYVSEPDGATVIRVDIIEAAITAALLANRPGEAS